MKEGMLILNIPSAGKCFRQRVSYIVHQRIHTGVLPYQCTACKKKFRYKVLSIFIYLNSKPRTIFENIF